MLQYTSNYKRGQKVGQMSHYAGNNMKSLHNSVEASLKKLRTDHIDISSETRNQWDWTCGIEEIMNGLHNLVVAGKVLYLVRPVIFFISEATAYQLLGHL